MANIADRNLTGLLCLGLVIAGALSLFGADKVAPGKEWKDGSVPFRLLNLTATATSFWACGIDESVMVSRDGGATWQQKHLKRDGETLLNIAFVDERVGYAAGTGGLLLSTLDGGETWKPHNLGGPVQSIAFSDAANGLAILGTHIPPRGLQRDGIAGVVKLTRDGGEHWEDVLDLQNNKKLAPYSDLLSVAVLDAMHRIIALHQPEGEDMYAVTQDGGKTWNAVHPENTFAGSILTHDGKYWAFGIEYLDRKNHGGYSKQVALFSKDGETWVHGVRGPGGFSSCNAQGCVLWDGAIESLFGPKEKFWSVPQDGSLTGKWALVGDRVCTISGNLKCGPAEATENVPPKPEQPAIITVNVRTDQFADDCLVCQVTRIKPDSELVANPAADPRPTTARITATVAVRKDGTVEDLSLTGAPSQRISDIITDSVKEWLFEPAHQGGSTAESKKAISLLLLCAQWPGRPETADCTLSPAATFDRARQQKQ